MRKCLQIPRICIRLRLAKQSTLEICLLSKPIPVKLLALCVLVWRGIDLLDLVRTDLFFWMQVFFATLNNLLAQKGALILMSATSSLGCGFDYPHIRDVVHCDLAHSVIDQYQEDSQGGRDGEACNATTFLLA